MSSRIIIHIDMDAFFAAVEQRDNPQLIGKPVIIGSDPKQGSGRGVVATCSYEARKYGVHSAMPISIAYKKCPRGVYLRGSYQKYKSVSRQVFSLLEEFTPDIQPISIDEAFLDVTGSYHLHGSALKTAQAIKRRIKEVTGLNASVGVAPNKMVAKIASDHCKPNGILVVPPKDVLSFLWPLDISKLWGVGKHTQARLHALKIKTIGDIAKSSREKLYEQLGEYGRQLHDKANGLDDRPVKVNEEIKSVSHEHTFEEDINDPIEIQNTILRLSEKVSRRLRKVGLKGKTISIKVRFKGFKTYTRAKTINQRLNFADDIYHCALGLYREFESPKNFIRLVGVRVSNFQDNYIQDSLFESPLSESKEKTHVVVDQIKDRYGEDAIFRAGYITKK